MAALCYHTVTPLLPAYVISLLFVSSHSFCDILTNNSLREVYQSPRIHSDHQHSMRLPMSVGQVKLLGWWSGQRSTVVA
ncbi:uncharacterized protein CLUP02_16795 [Colletotrichum lupini]|uniref:Uncharacterized protein n=1 Tax=Colletotrichum lupini TaxID=145971 RepID=A0A9Q8T8J8_9PEZI|nr:uncharacterized protein CLUP02_16795 [Colletotrichum lupini]KAK1703414.1 hypothetical protein BDP67DRAFT_535844 [Colletotrichum lupini]UQC91261.1 hypothetical protein CLUP02_16795 [Colletotrichum lupini]